MSRHADEALCLTEVPNEELAAIAGEEQDLLCIQPTDHAIYRIRRVCGQRASVRPHGVALDAEIVASQSGAHTPKGLVRVHFCRTVPCKTKFTGITAPVPYVHLVRLRATAREHHEDLASYAPSIQPALAPTPVGDQIRRYAEYVRSPSRFVGIYTFLAFAVQERVEVRMWFTKTHYVDIVASYASWSQVIEIDSVASSSTPAPAAKTYHVLACVLESVGENVRSIRMLTSMQEISLVNHYLPLIQRGTCERQNLEHPPCNGALCSKLGEACMAQVRADVSTLGMFPVRSITNGDCAFDTMLFLQNESRSNMMRRSKRTLLALFMLDRVDDANWRASWIACGESAPEPPPAASSPTAAYPPPSDTSASASDSLSGAVLELGSSKIADAVVQPPAPAAPSPASQIPQPPAPAAQIPDAPVASPSTSSSSTGPPASSANSSAAQAHPEVVAAAIMAFVGQSKISPGEIRRLASTLSQEQTNNLVKEYEEQMAAKAKKESSALAGSLLRRRCRNDRFVDTRNDDAEIVAKFAARRGVQCSAVRVPTGFWKAFFEETYQKERLQKESAKSIMALKMYWKRRLCEYGKKETVTSTKGVRLGGQIHAHKRKRRLRNQGRPVLATGIEEGLLSWFVDLRRRGVRVGPRAFRKRALALRSIHMAAALKKGIKAPVPSCSYKYCRGVRRRLRISLRAPLIKWKVSRPVMNERMEICWLNLAKIIEFCLLFHGYEPILDSRDQTGKHMNECGSKNRKTLAWQGDCDVALREDHNATRKRWTAFTQCLSSLEETPPGHRPFCELLFQGGAQILAGLEEVVNNLRACGVEVEWLTVAVSDSGSYRAEHVIDYLEKTLLPWGPDRRWRILMLDAYRAHLIDAVKRLAWKRGYIVVYQGGGCTGISQVNDTDQNETVDGKCSGLDVDLILISEENTMYVTQKRVGKWFPR